ncbi:MAG: hypothetical protein D6744_18585 [Planctomycetota bacterium]|nr:MAG: hypothetical protein D6744_18585 [Planctomycetota bacterium]
MLDDGRREPRRSLIKTLRQRLYGTLADFEDCNDPDDCRHRPNHAREKGVGHAERRSHPQIPPN